MRVLVTGGAGFIGSHLVAACCGEGWEVSVLDDFSTSGDDGRRNLEIIAAQGAKFSLTNGSAANLDVVNLAAHGQEVIFHLAAWPSVPKSVQDPEGAYANGTMATARVLEAARVAGVRRVVFSSSSSVYGECEVFPQYEELPVSPVSPYAATKAAGEAMCSAYASCYDLDTISLRYFNVFGPRQQATSSYSGVIAKFCQAACAGNPLVIEGTGRQSRDFTFVADVVRANLLAARHSARLDGKIVNVGTGYSVSVVGLVEALSKITGKALVASHGPARAGDVQKTQADIIRARMLLEFSPSYRFLDGLSETMAWYKGGA
jgi:UDP-glucose 4-epimerase